MWWRGGAGGGRGVVGGKVFAGEVTQPAPTAQKSFSVTFVLHYYTTKTTMPNTNIQTGQDWGSVNVGRSSAGRVAVPKTAHGVTRAKAMGLVATVSFLFLKLFALVSISLTLFVV